MKTEKIITPIEAERYFLRIPIAVAQSLPRTGHSCMLRVALDGWGGTRNYNIGFQQLTGLSAWFHRKGLKAGDTITLSLDRGRLRIRRWRQTRHVLSSANKPPLVKSSAGRGRAREDERPVLPIIANGQSDSLQIHVEGRPPWKQGNVNGEGKESLRDAAKLVVNQRGTLDGNVWLSVHYQRAGTRSQQTDAANIVGGIADVLQKAGCYSNDVAIRQIEYIEHHGNKDEYWVTVTPARW